jgi:hypothetical protein
MWINAHVEGNPYNPCRVGQLLLADVPRVGEKVSLLITKGKAVFEVVDVVWPYNSKVSPPTVMLRGVGWAATSFGGIVLEALGFSVVKDDAAPSYTSEFGRLADHLIDKTMSLVADNYPKLPDGQAVVMRVEVRRHLSCFEVSLAEAGEGGKVLAQRQEFVEYRDGAPTARQESAEGETESPTTKSSESGEAESSAAGQPEEMPTISEGAFDPNVVELLKLSRDEDYGEMLRLSNLMAIVGEDDVSGCSSLWEYLVEQKFEQSFIDRVAKVFWYQAFNIAKELPYRHVVTANAWQTERKLMTHLLTEVCRAMKEGYPKE